MSKVVFITGISSGFGKQTATLLAQKGYKVYGTSRRDIEAGEGISVIKADVTDAASVKQAVESVLQIEDSINVLINNAGMGIAGSIEETSIDEVKLQMDTNFYGALHTIEAVLPSMREKRNGLIITISSVGGLMGLPYVGYYAASKFALEGLCESLYMEVKPFNVKVVLINPGDFHTNFTASRKIIAGATADSPYDNYFRKTLATIEKDELSGLPPEKLARKLLKIIEKKNPRARYVVATFEQKLAVVLKYLLPDAWFFSILSSHYKIK
jgi:short-subunit dehydrogenase